MADGNMTLQELSDELSFQRILLSSVDDTITDLQEAQELKFEISKEIARLQKLIVAASRQDDPFYMSSQNSNAHDAAIDLTDNNMSAPDPRDMNVSLGRKRSKLTPSPEYRPSKSRKTTPNLSGATTPDLPISYSVRQKEEGARLASEAFDEEMARKLSQQISHPLTASPSYVNPVYNAFDRLAGRPPPSQSSKFTIKPEPKAPAAGMEGWHDAIELTDDSDDLVEIRPNQFRSNDRKPSAAQLAQQSADAPLDLTRNMDGSLVQSYGFPPAEAARLATLQHTYGANSFAMNTYGNPLAMNSYASSSRGFDVPGALAGVGTSSIHKPQFYMEPSGLFSDLYPNLSSVGNGLVAAASALSDIIQNPVDFDLTAGLNEAGNPISAELSHLYNSINDPTKTKKELLALLDNIQDDIDMAKADRKGTPDGLKYPLYEYQKIALTWMMRMEDSKNNRGGILADDMGLGKTISALALILSRKSDELARKTTLIVGPVALVRQWQSEIENKVTASHRLSTFLYHGTKSSWENLRKFDIVLTTYGTLSAELKRLETWENDLKAHPEMNQSKVNTILPLLGPKSNWYRVILDEAQCIKNHKTVAARACCLLKSIFRFCLTGTPMMNNIGEFYSLIHFLRIKPYNDWTSFREDFGCLLKNKTNDQDLKRTMGKLRVVIKAILLRRTKASLIDGKPILELPEKVEEVQHVVFDEDQQAFYTSLETRTRLDFNKFRKAGTIGKNYANVLVLLLRLRQAACHPHLITDYEEVPSSADLTVDEMVKLAETLTPDVIGRIKAVELFECPVCYEPVGNPRLVVPCGHDTCSECLVKIVESAGSEGIANGEENSVAKCPTCRGQVSLRKVIDFATFKKVHYPSPKIEEKESDPDSDSDSCSDSDSEIDGSDDQDLKDFVVPDEYDSGDEAEDEEEDDFVLPANPFDKPSEKNPESIKTKCEKNKKAKKTKKPKGSSKGKGKAKEEKANHLNLATLRKEASKSREHKKKYMRYLRKNYVPSAKITKCIELLRDAVARNTKTIVFSQFTALLDLIEVQLEQEAFKYERYDGTMSANARHDAVVKFTRGKDCQVFLISLKAGNSGLNLVEASNVIIMDPFWNPFIEMQAVDRAHRIGQQQKVQVHRIIVKGTVEDRILELQERKKKMVDSALDENASRTLARLGQRELIYLFNGHGSTNDD